MFINKKSTVNLRILSSLTFGRSQNVICLPQTSAQSSFHSPAPKTAFLHELSDCWDLKADEAGRAPQKMSRPS